MIVDSISFSRGPSVCRIQAKVACASAVEPEFPVIFDVHTEIEPPSPEGDPWLAALITPAMFLGEDLVINAPVSKRLLEQVRQVQRILHSWFPDLLQEIQVRTLKADERTNRTGPQVTACFFSGGVDSWYSLLKHEKEVEAIVTVKGFDLPYSDTSIWPELARANTRIASELRRDLILVETNLRDQLDPTYKVFRKQNHTDFWGECMHGAGMACVGLLLGSRFSRVIIPGSMQYAFLPPWGSHPLLDPLWSTCKVQFIHDGCEHLRLEKLRAIARSEIVLKHLRVCPAYVPGRYNCCECEKCKRTMLTLRLFKVLDQAACFDKPLDLSSMEHLILPPIYHPTYTEILNEACAVGDREVESLIRVLLGQKISAAREWKKARGRLSRVLPRWKRSINKRLLHLLPQGKR